MAIRWWRLLLTLVAVAMMWCGPSPAEARQAAPDVCRADRLGARITYADIQFRLHGRTFVEVESDMTVKVPAEKWPLVHDLTLSEESSRYRMAMRCLLRGQDNHPRNQEWRFHEPRVTAQHDWVTVQYDALAWIENVGTVQLGPWEIHVDAKENWKILLRPPTTLQRARWERIEVGLGGLNAERISEPASSADGNSLVWTEKPARGVEVDVDPPWQRALALRNKQSLWSTAGIASWWVCASVVIALAALRVPRPNSPSGSGGPRRHARRRFGRCVDSPTQVVLQWAVLSAAVALTVLLLISRPVIPIEPTWRALISLATGLALVLVARPWCCTALSAGPEGVQRRQARAVVAAVSLVAAIGSLVALTPQLFGPRAGLKAEVPPTVSGLVGLALLGLATLWLWLAAMVSWAWRFAREGGLEGKKWNEKWAKAPVRCVAVVGALQAVVAGVMLAFFWWAYERQWKRATWLIDQTDTSAHDINVSKFLATFPLTGLTWLYAYTWMLTGIALVALLRYRVKGQNTHSGRRQHELSLGPDKADLLLTAAVFAFVVGLRNVSFAGSAALYGVWLPLNILSLYAVLYVGRRWSVLSEAGDRFRMERMNTKNHRSVLLNKAHKYRNLHHQLYLVDHGRAEGVKREDLEDQLGKLRQWLVSEYGENSLPDQISVLDVALAWGPDGRWWRNARHAAGLAFYFGIPASVALVWLLHLKDYRKWTLTLHDPIGFPEIVANFITYQVAWAGAGFVLGALWRLLPGRRGPVRALSLTVAYAIPVCLGALLSHITDTELGYTFLNVLLILTILTLTSIWMDTGTFSEERQFWPTRFGLLSSVYQLRGLSAQIAYLLAQVSVAIGIWVHLAGSESLPR
ncbi:DUF6185 family protein, partial [Streptomyces roseifaciens]